MLQTTARLADGREIGIDADLSRLAGLDKLRPHVLLAREAIASLAKTYARLDDTAEAAERAGVSTEELAVRVASAAFQALVERPTECAALGFGPDLARTARLPREPREARRLVATKLDDGSMIVDDVPLPVGGAAA